MRSLKLFMTIALLIFAVVGYVLYEQYLNMKETRLQLLQNEGRSLSYFTEAFRETYQHIFAENHIRVTDGSVVFLPVMTIDTIAK